MLQAADYDGVGFYPLCVVTAVTEKEIKASE